MRRRLLAWTVLSLVALAQAAGHGDDAPDYPMLSPGLTLHFPDDFAAHPDFRIEWWYVTGWLQTDDHRSLGFQVTFFRSRPYVDQSNPSPFAAKQLLFAHAALSDPALGRLQHDQRAARAGFGLAEASTRAMDIVIDDWRMQRDEDGRIITRIAADNFAFDFTFAPTQPVLPQGIQGYSRKGPESGQASAYFSLPHLRVAGSLREGRNSRPVTGEAWLDREWSSTLLPPTAVGWDWFAANLSDGGALTLFRIRDQAGQALWAGGSYRDGSGGLTVLDPDAVRFSAAKLWHSARSGADYPVAADITVRLPGGVRRLQIRPMFDDQELDSRPAGPIYWEGAARLSDDQGQMLGLGYLELTGYAEKLRY